VHGTLPIRNKESIMISGIGNASQLSSNLFKALDTKSQGFLEKSDFIAAFSKLSSNSSSGIANSASSTTSTSVDDVFSALDSDSDGKVTKSEFASTLAKLQEQLDSQFNQTRMQGGGGPGGPQGMNGPPPPPPANDAGFTKDELTSKIKEIGSTDSKRTDLMSKIANNFEAADTNSDGKVSFTEAMAYDKASQATTSSTNSASSSNTASSNPDAGIMMKIMQLMHAYGNSSQDQASNTLASLISVNA
jgi:Ca2+-binding EF-hand superfamily protein